jgi:citrate lyase subunit beta/citryl-CoA lyase
MIGRSAIFMPANIPSMINSAVVLHSDSIVFDLEDAIPLEEKDSARILLREAFKSLDFIREKNILIRVNNPSTAYFDEDIKEIVPLGDYPLVIPKVDLSNMSIVNEKLERIESEYKLNYQVPIAPLIETAFGVEYINQILKSSERIIAVFWGAEDFTADMGIARTPEGSELWYSRSKLTIAAHIAGVEVIDTPFTDIKNLAGLRKDAAVAKQLGFTGKAAIHPSQIDVINEVFSPSQEEIEYSLRVVKAFTEGKKEGKGVVLENGRMIDEPVVTRAKLILKKARLGMGEEE